MDRCQREKENLYHLKMEDMDKSTKQSFQSIDKRLKSYFIPRKSNEYYMEYEYDTLPELKKYMDDLWRDDTYMQGIEKILLVAALKNKPQDDVKLTGKDSQNIKDSDSSDRLPEYIYVF